MFPRKYVTVTIRIVGQQPIRDSVPTDKAHDHAAERYEHYRHELGSYTGSQRHNGFVIDTFDHGTIWIED
jgi:hypothetical protein